MFRDFTKRSADKFGIVGTVRNADDGTVHIIAEGESGALDIFLHAIRKGSFLSRVDAVDVIESQQTGEFSDFNILYA